MRRGQSKTKDKKMCRQLQSGRNDDVYAWICESPRCNLRGRSFWPLLWVFFWGTPVPKNKAKEPLNGKVRGVALPKNSLSEKGRQPVAWRPFFRRPFGPGKATLPKPFGNRYALTSLVNSISRSAFLWMFCKEEHFGNGVPTANFQGGCRTASNSTTYLGFQVLNPDWT